MDAYIRRAYFNAKATRDIYVELPPEDPRYHDENACGTLVLSIYGTRDAASNWEDECTNKLLSWGFTRGKSSPCIFNHTKRDIQLIIHGDGFVAEGSGSAVRWLQQQMSAAYNIKHNIMGDAPNSQPHRNLATKIHHLPGGPQAL